MARISLPYLSDLYIWTYVYGRLKSLALQVGQLRLEMLNDLLKVERTDFMSELKLKNTSFIKIYH